MHNTASLISSTSSEELAGAGGLGSEFSGDNWKFPHNPERLGNFANKTDTMPLWRVDHPG